jgi:hypothetical protein
LFDSDTTRELWSHIPPQFLTQARFTVIAALCQQHRDNPEDGRRAFVAYVNREILGMNAAPAVACINGAQTTHTASVHASVSQSATALKARYGKELKRQTLAAVIKDVSQYINGLSDNDMKYAAAKRCITRITKSNGYGDFVDPTSQISTKTLLALVWLAAQDRSRRRATLADALTSLIDAFYQIQREYNISLTGVDDKSRDSSMCPSGTFNKLVDGLNGIHDECQIVFVTKELAAAKLPRVVCAVLLEHLKAPRPGDALTLLLTQLDKDGLDLVWEVIRERVSQRMFEEFGTLYGGIDSAAFVGLIDAGIDTDVGAVVRDAKSLQALPAAGFYAASAPSTNTDDGEENDLVDLAGPLP